MTYHNFSFNTLAIDTDSLVVNYKTCPNKLPASWQQGSITLQIRLNGSLLHYPKQKLLIPSGQRCSLDVKGRLGGISFGLSAVICAFICNIVYDSIHLHHVSLFSHISRGLLWMAALQHFPRRMSPLVIRFIIIIIIIAIIDVIINSRISFRRKTDVAISV